MENSMITLQSIGQEILRNKVSTMFKVVRPSLLTRSLLSKEEPIGLADLLKKVTTNNTTVSSVVQLPDEPQKLDISDLQNLEDISLLNSFASVAATSMIYEEKKTFKFSPAEMVEYQKLYMQNFFKVMTQGLSGLLAFEESSANTFNADFNPQFFHDDFLKQLFGSFSLPETSVKQLDSVLNQISGNLSGIQKTGVKVPTDYCVIYYFFAPVIGLESVRLPSLRIFNIHIGQEFVERTISKNEKATVFRFEMSYTEYQAKMDVSGMNYHRDNLRKYIEVLTKNSLDEIMSIVQPTAVS